MFYKGVIYRILTPIVAVFSGVFGYSLALISDSVNADEYVLKTGLSSFFMVFVFSFIGHYKQKINKQKTQLLIDVSIFYSIICFLISIFLLIFSYLIGDNFYLPLLFLNVAIQCSFFLVSFNYQINRNKQFWKFQFISTNFRLIALCIFYIAGLINFYFLILSNLIASFALSVLYFNNHISNLKKFSIPNVTFNLKQNVDGFFRNFRNEIEYQFLILIGLVGKNIGISSTFLSLIPFINAFRISIRTLLNNIDTRIISIKLSTLNMILGMFFFILSTFISDYIYEFIIFKFDIILFNLHKYLLIIFSFALWTTGMLGVELKTKKSLKFFYFKLAFVLLISVMSLVINKNYIVAMLIFYIGIGLSLRYNFKWEE